MSNTPSAASLKERCEMQIISELVCEPSLAALNPVKQNADTKPKMPYITVVCTVGKEISPQANIFNVAGELGFYFDTKRSGQDGEALDKEVALAIEQLQIAQARGEYGLIINGEQPVAFVSDAIRKRVISFSLIAG